MVKRKNKKFGNLFYYIAGILVVLILILILIFEPLNVETFDVKFSVGNTTGFDLNTSVLSFGRMLPGNSITRDIILENFYDFDVNIDVYISKNIKRFVVSESGVLIEKGEKIIIPVSLFVTSDAEFGNYFGEIKFVFSRA